MKLIHTPTAITLCKGIFCALLLILFSSVFVEGKAGILRSKPPQDDKVYDNVEQQPEPQGGFKEFYNFLSKTVKYPSEARKNKIQGRVAVQFIVEKDGSINNVKAMRGPGYGLNEEAVRVIRLSPKWKPGIQKGKAVRVMYTVPVNFRLG